MDNAGSAELQQNPNPTPNTNPNDNPNLNYNFDYSLLQTANYSAGYPHNANSDPYQPPGTDPHNALYVPQPGPPGVDPPYVPPSVTVSYVQQATTFETQQAAVAAAAAAASYYRDQQPTTFDPQQAAAAAAAAAAATAASYYQDPSASWATAVRQYGVDPFAAAVTTTNPAVQFQRTNTWKKGSKKTKVVQSAWCEVCKIDCTSKAVLDQHKLGKKHKKNLEKLKAPPTTMPAPSFAATPPAIAAAPPAILSASLACVATASPASVATATPAILSASQAAVATSTPLPTPVSAPIDKPVIGPEENPDKSNPSISKKSRKKAAARTEDLETKRRKVLDGGAAAEAVRACSICNVVCNSDTVFRYHLAGQKHASMIKKHTARAGVASAM